MYIKQIIIQGFKSYKDQTVIEPFSPRHNVVVGRNGSGKSNFFSAIRFVLSDAYTSMGREERQALLHEGAGPATMSAYVEVIFDNVDNRFPTGKDEVILRRTIGLKKDEYTLDKKSASKAEVMNLLEAAGFSRSNPYFIVPQGRIAALTNAKDPERLALLKEIAGTEVYERRRVESLKIIDETVSKREKISKLLEDIEERLKELEAEKKELKEYQENDKERRCLEYTIYSREMAEVNESLEKVEGERLRESEVIYECETQFATREQAITDADFELRKHQQALDVISIEKNRLTEDKQELLMEVARLELEVHDLENNVRAAESAKEEAAESLRSLDKEIKHNEANLEYEQPFFMKALTAEEEVKEKLHKSNAALEALYGKQGRIVHFRNKKERDQFLQREISNIRRSIVDENVQARALKDDVEKALEKRNKLECEIKELEEELRAGKNAAVEIESTTSNIRKIRDELTDKRKELWRQEAVLAARVKTDKDEVIRAEYALRGTMEKSVAHGLPMVAKIAEKLRLDGFYGPLYDLFEVPERYRAAVETIGNKSLFNVVVDTDETAARILDEMNRDRHSDRAGRVTFMPMNRIRVRPQQYPDSKECLPMIKRLRFDSKFEKAFQAVFGKAIICPNLGIASQFSRAHNLSAVTLDGDQADRKGAISGGYRDQHSSRLACAEKLREWRKTLCEDTERHADVVSQVAVADQEISSAVGDLNNRESQLRRLVKAREQHNIDLACRRRELVLTKEMLVGREKALAKVETGIRQLEEQVRSYQGEMDGEFGTGLSPHEQERLDELVDESGKLRSQLVELSEERAKWELKINAYKNALEVNLRPRLRDLEAKLEQEDNTSSINEHLKEKERELSVSRKRISDTNHKLQSREKNAEAEAVHIARVTQQLEALKVAQQESAAQMERAQKGSEKYLSRRSVLLHKKEECTRNIRDLGVLPEEAFEKYTRTSSQKLLKKLHKINEKLKKFAHVNKKALEQYNSFTKQRDALLNRKKELDSGSKAIDNLIKTLDQQKDEAIQRTFKQVARYFSEVFEKLVPAGRGSLIMQRRIDEEAECDDDGGHRNPVNAIDSYTGISIKVSFNSKTDEGLRMQQLSGGQKSLVSLALIFAIQRCDPAPFYLFDEIDANLDAAHRTAVANMIHELADNAQFITTTFRPEMLSKADKFYGVMFNKKVSRISCITKEDALDFVQQEQPQ